MICVFGNFLNPLATSLGRVFSETQRKAQRSNSTEKVQCVASVVTLHHRHEGVCGRVTGCSRVGCGQEGLGDHMCDFPTFLSSSAFPMVQSEAKQR